MAPASRHRPAAAGHVLLTGASGTLGRVLAPGLSAAGHRLLLSDLLPFPDPLPGGARFAAADITDKAALAAACPDDVSDIVHFGGINTETDPEAILKVNIGGTLNVFELARKRRARVIFASSNHAIGFYPRRQQPLTIADPCRPDGHYGVSKVYAEALGRLYHDKHGIESVHLRIGSCLPQPLDTRHLATWLSYPDLVRLVLAALAAPEVGYGVVWGISANTRRWWTGDDAHRIGFVPQDNTEDFADQVEPEAGDAVTRRFQGGSHCGIGYSRQG
ncbi:NAD-dependent epimerase/dehydratase family protein [Bosea psychrotolerans]|uniref:Uronate dehydrogenase n=1 Tax=Bosea psychrotolerans TaxID=1871628 RepID=A0A2S4M0P7_9HYPH|nr:NAD(P)-dependent oxidoreductase [Bosea psychrotolerans]POR48280.1 uronate dehydrogenase [Bosea psychrotolerans]